MHETAPSNKPVRAMLKPISYARRTASAFLIAAACALVLPVEANAQSGRGNAKIMEISLNADSTECVGSPDTVTVKPGDVLVFLAKDVNVQFVDWRLKNPNVERQLTQNQAAQGRTPAFPNKSAYAVRINRAISDTTAYKLKLKCGGIGDAPPTVIVTP